VLLDLAVRVPARLYNDTSSGLRSEADPRERQLIDADSLLRRSPIPECRRTVVDSVEAVNNVPVNNVPEPIPERLRDAVWSAEDTGDPKVLDALSPEDYDTAVRYLKGIQANVAQVLDTPRAKRT
jgi:hypothetical protein